MPKHSIYIIISCLLVSLAAVAQGQRPWVECVSRPNTVTQGLAGRCLGVWPSHGRFYNERTGRWEWQRPLIYGTCEDLFTSTIVVPYLIPMLEQAGANVFVPRERDWQTEEKVVDNDAAYTGYMERPATEPWQNCPRPGFATPRRASRDGDRPFASGTARMARATPSATTTRAYYRPNLAVAGRYAVYVSYQTVDGSVDDAEYTVVHQGVATKFLVNQRMGSSTWVYLGTFEFDRYSTYSNYVMVTNHSRRTGFITTDAVRFGGGMGTTQRGGTVSHVPRAMECARYWAQYAGAPRAAVCSKGGHDDYGDDINTRSLMANWLSYGSRTNPTEGGKGELATLDADTTTLADAAAKAYLATVCRDTLDSAALARTDSIAAAIRDSVARVPFQHINVMRGAAKTGRVPIELQLAIHSDAGRSDDLRTPFGSLTICTSNFNDKHLANGEPRSRSFELASDLLYDVQRDLKRELGDWTIREIWDKNYSETRLPAQPSAILETLSHENFGDIRLGHDPQFKSLLARSVYKTLLRYIARHNGTKATVLPLAPRRFAACRMKANVLTLSWQPQSDQYEPTAEPTSYNVYTRIGSRGYDNGTAVSATEYTLVLQPNKIYRFRVTATNAGGESFPTEELVALYTPAARETVMIVNAFHRLSGPTVVDTDTLCGFDLDNDIGLSYGKTLAWAGRQTEFRRSHAGRGLGHTTNELLGRFTAGNDFNYSYSHAEALAAAMPCNIVSLSSEAYDTSTPTDRVTLLDLLLGNERDDRHSLLPYKTFTAQTRAAVSGYVARGGRVVASGSYIASDMQSDDEKQWLAHTLGITCGGTDRDSLAFRTDSLTDLVSLGDKTISVFRHVSGDHYASVSSDIIVPADSLAQASLTPLARYASGASAACATPQAVCLGFPIECVKEPADRLALFRRILAALPKQ